MGTIDTAVAEALVQKLLDEVVIHRFDEAEEVTVLTSISVECQTRSAINAQVSFIVKKLEASRHSAFTCAISCDRLVA